MSLYVKVSVGPVHYLIAATQVAQLGPAGEAADDACPAIDCRALFGTHAETPGFRLDAVGDGEAPISLIVDRIDGLVEIGDDSFRRLPAIGRFGPVIDAIAMPVGTEPPALRLRIGAALLAGLPSRGEEPAGAGDIAAR